MRMDDHKSVAWACLEGAAVGTMTFPQIVVALTQEGFESYAIDFRRAAATHYLPDGDSLELPVHSIDIPVARPSTRRALKPPSRKRRAPGGPAIHLGASARKSPRPAVPDASSRFPAAARLTSAERLKRTWEPS